MKIKRYLVSDMREAYQMIKNDLGPEAVIIGSRKVRSRGLKGMVGSKMIEVTAAVERTRPDTDAPAFEVKPEKTEMEQELMEVKSMLKRLVVDSEDSESAVGKWKEALQGTEVGATLVDELLTGISEAMDGGSENEKLVRQALVTRLTRVFENIEERPVGHDIYAFVGPTGVGKTTTLAKLAAHHVFDLRQKVGLITVDTYRIGAVEQLRTYGEIMGIDVDVAMTPEQLCAAVRKHDDKDIILIDTAGRPASNGMKLAEVRSFLQPLRPLEVCLVLSCTTKQQDLERIAIGYKVLDYSCLIFTKLDETDTFGAIANVAHRVQKPVAFVTNGQNVPDDIRFADPLGLAKLILGEVG